MSSSAAFNVEVLPEFKDDLEGLVKKFYPGKRNQHSEALGERLEGLLDHHAAQPLRNTKNCKPIGFPNVKTVKSYNRTWVLRKQYFMLPGLSGAPAEGRILYIVCKATREVKWLMVYTHKDFLGQPKDSVIAARIAGALAP